MGELLGKLIEILPTYAGAMFIAGLAILLLPAGLTTQLGMDSWRADYRPWVIVLTIFTGAVCLVRLLVYLRDRIAAAFAAAHDRRNAEVMAEATRAGTLRFLDTLTENEQAILQLLLYRGERTITGPTGTAALSSLVSKGLLHMAAGVGNAVDWPFTIPEFVWNELVRRRDQFLPAGIDEHKAGRLRSRVTAILDDGW